MCCCSQVSPWAMVPSCMSLLRFGSMIATVGNVLKSVGKLVKGWFEVVGMLVKFTHGACLRAYAPEVQTVDPADGRSSENPVKVSPAAANSVARFSVEKVCGQVSSVMPWFDPENRSR